MCLPDHQCARKKSDKKETVSESANVLFFENAFPNVLFIALIVSYYCTPFPPRSANETVDNETVNTECARFPVTCIIQTAHAARAQARLRRAPTGLCEYCSVRLSAETRRQPARGGEYRAPSFGSIAPKGASASRKISLRGSVPCARDPRAIRRLHTRRSVLPCISPCLHYAGPHSGRRGL